MAVRSKVFYDGFLPTSKGTLATVPASTDDMPTFGSFHNVNSATQTVVLYANPSGTSRIIARFQLLQNETARVALPPLEAADLIEGETTTASAVHGVISGAQRT